MIEPPLHYLSATELGRLIRSGEISSIELTSHFLKRLNSRGRELNAVAEITEALAMEQAQVADREAATGHFRSPLHGVPYGAKDLLSVANVPTRWGSPAHSSQVFDFDATAVSKLRSAGAVLLGKLAMVELAGGGSYESPSASLHGPGLNPWNPEFWSGGSSSGSGSAVGGGCVGFALGSETWGSITCPASFCGISGLRPTYGRVSRHGAMALCWTLDKIGPMARSAEDCAHILEIIAGYDPQDRTSASGSFNFDADASTRPLRIGILPHDYANAREVEACFDEAKKIFEVGNKLSDIAWTPDIPYDLVTGLIVSVEGSAAFEKLIRSERLSLLKDEYQEAGLIAGLSIPSSDYLKALRIRTLAQHAISKLWDVCDVLIAPTLLRTANPIQERFVESVAPWGGNGGPGNLAGLPSISIPMGFQGGLPLGLEIIGKPFDEQTILSLAIRFQQETEWHRSYPDD